MNEELFLYIFKTMCSQEEKKCDYICFFFGQGDMFLQYFNAKKFTNIVIIVSSI
jgi:hypothetical protein